MYKNSYCQVRAESHDFVKDVKRAIFMVRCLHSYWLLDAQDLWWMYVHVHVHVHTYA